MSDWGMAVVVLRVYGDGVGGRGGMVVVVVGVGGGRAEGLGAGGGGVKNDGDGVDGGCDRGSGGLPFITSCHRTGVLTVVSKKICK